MAALTPRGTKVLVEPVLPSDHRALSPSLQGSPASFTMVDRYSALTEPMGRSSQKLRFYLSFGMAYYTRLELMPRLSLSPQAIIFSHVG